MQVLKDILYKVRITEVIGSTQLAITSITADSRQCKPGTLFVAVRGEVTNGHTYIEAAIDKGAVAIICSEIPNHVHEHITYIVVADSAESLGIAASNFYDNPSTKITLIGVTGTNGKTTTATLLYNLFSELGYSCGLISTVENRINNTVFPATHTTPDAVSLQHLLNEMHEQGCTYCFMEVSSHAVVQKRIAGVHFAGAVFTNITHDHLDYHKTFDAYIQAKKGFFDMLTPDAFALVNKDDKHAGIMLQNTRATKKSFALKSMADFNVKIIEQHVAETLLNIDGNDVWVQLIGGFNAYNMLGIYSVAVLLGIDKLTALTAISKLQAVEGRFQHFKTETNITAIVDYAHTPDALKNVLTTIKEIRTGNEQVITVVGCGGNRDKEKRPLMAATACALSDKVILTSDNPRNENPEDILADMRKGVEALHVKKVLIITNRAEAIKTACTLATDGDILLVAGKGHEKYQEIQGVRYPFDDLEQLKEQFKILEK